MSEWEIMHGDCREVVALFDDNTFDAILTDAPYELNFMGSDWDRSGISYDPATWTALMRVLKPGGHMLCFSGCRTEHRVACAIENGGFEIRDKLIYLYGSGFPKSHNVSLAIDKAKGGKDRGKAVATASTKLPYQGGQYGQQSEEKLPSGQQLPAYDPQSDEVKQWDGWGTNLKPAWEPVILGYKPLTFEQFLTVISEHLIQEITKWWIVNVGDAERLFKSTLVESSEGAASSVLVNARTSAWESFVTVPSAELVSTFNLLASSTQSETQDDSVLRNVRESGKASIAEDQIIPHGKVEDILIRLQDISTSAMTEGISENIAVSWKNLLEESLTQASKFTMSTATRLITGLKILRFCLPQNTSIDTGSSSLSPAWEPIILARKPLGEKTIAANVLQHGVGAINVDACRIGDEEVPINKLEQWSRFGQKVKPDYTATISKGRWPANLLLDNESAELLDADAGEVGNKWKKNYGDQYADEQRQYKGGTFAGGGYLGNSTYSDSGGPSRFFYTSKTNKREKTMDGQVENVSLTMKPRDLLRYLVRLITPPGGIVLDPFCGSGNSGTACLSEGFDYMGIELLERDAEIARERLEIHESSLH